MWQAAWKDLWRYMDRVSLRTVDTWAQHYHCRALVVPATPEWLHGLYLIELPDGVRWGFPLDASGDLCPRDQFGVDTAQWETIGALCEREQARWAHVCRQRSQWTTKTVASAS